MKVKIPSNSYVSENTYLRAGKLGGDAHREATIIALTDDFLSFITSSPILMLYR